MQKRAIFLFFFIALCVNAAQAGNDFFTEEFTFKTSEGHEIDVDVVLNETLRERRDLVLSKVVSSLRQCESKMGLSLRENVSIFFDVQPDYHNGLTTVIPTNRIMVITEAPALESSIGLNADFLGETILHELAHMTVMQRYGGLFSLFDPFVGNTARPLGLWPRWLHEGLAVWTEGARGGRPHSGYLEYDRRRYAESTVRRKKAPFSDEQLDGGSTLQADDPHGRGLSKVESGALPYHFGYYLVTDLLEGGERPLVLPEFIKTSSKSLGMSFRVILRDTFGINLDQRFAELQKRWADPALLGPPALPPTSPPANVKTSADPAPKGLRNAPPDATGLINAGEILGPFHATLGTEATLPARSVTWIEQAGREGSGVFVKARTHGEPKLARLAWNRPFASPIQAIYLGKDRWLVLSREHPNRGALFADTRLPFGKTLLLIEAEKVRCAFKIGPRLREFHYSQGWLSWVRNDETGDYFAEKAPWTGEGCEPTVPAQLIARSESPFQRLTSLYVDAGNTIYSRTDPTGPVVAEHLFWNGRRIEEPIPLGFAVPYKDGLLATAFSKTHWGPVLIRPDAGGQPRIEGYIALRTGAYRSVPALDADAVWVKESFWEEDRLSAFPRASFAPANGSQLHSAHPALATPSTDPLPKTETSDYGAWPSIWPHFWVPSIIAVTGGYAVIGQVFYEDLSQTWAGATVGGYDSFLRRPFVSTSLTRSKLGFGPFNSLTTQGFYSPVSTVFNGQLLVQDRYGASVSLGAGGLVGGFRLSEAISATYLQARPSTVSEGYTRIIPAVTVNLSSDKYQGTESPAFQLFRVQHAFAVGGSLRHIRQLEAFARFNWQAPLPFGTGLLFSTEYGWTDGGNFPVSYFEVGGLPSIATANTNFLTRGYSYRLTSAKEAVRVATEIGIGLGRIGGGLGWNRFSLNESQFRAIAEAVSFTTFSGTRFRVGRQYFATAGGELDLIGSTLFYVDYRISLGAYRGFGPFGETRYALILRSGLDL